MVNLPLDELKYAHLKYGTVSFFLKGPLTPEQYDLVCELCISLEQSTTVEWRYKYDLNEEKRDLVRKGLEVQSSTTAVE